MQLFILTALATLATFGAASPVAKPEAAGIIFPRAINRAYFSEAELADQN